MSRDRSFRKRISFCINDHPDILIEVLKRLDGRSLSVAACVCRLWSAVATTDSIWEYLCFRHHVSPLPSSSGIRSVVSALGGYRRLYMICVRPLHSRLRGPTRLAAAWSRVELQLSLSLFCVDYYERLGPPCPTRFGDVSGSSSSLMFLCKPVNV